MCGSSKYIPNRPYTIIIYVLHTDTDNNHNHYTPPLRLRKDHPGTIAIMPVTTVFEIGPGKFTVILYPTPTNVSSPSTSTQATHSTTTTYGTTRTATRSMDKNIHQVSTSIDDLNNNNNNNSYTAAYPALASTWSSAPSSSPSTAGVGETTILDGTTYTLGVEPFTYTSNGGVYTSVRVQRVPVQTSSEREVQEKNKRYVDPFQEEILSGYGQVAEWS